LPVPVLSRLFRGKYLFEQGLAPRVVTPEEMFLACE
jgi:hypothetical protein